LLFALFMFKDLGCSLIQLPGCVVRSWVGCPVPVLPPFDLLCIIPTPEGPRVPWRRIHPANVICFFVCYLRPYQGTGEEFRMKFSQKGCLREGQRVKRGSWEETERAGTSVEGLGFLKISHDFHFAKQFTQVCVFPPPPPPHQGPERGVDGTAGPTRGASSTARSTGPGSASTPMGAATPREGVTTGAVFSQDSGFAFSFPVGFRLQ